MFSELQQIESAIAGLESQRALLGDAVADAALVPLRARRAALAATPLPPASTAQIRKQVTILFLDVVGSTTLSQQLDPEDIHAVMDGHYWLGREEVRNLVQTLRQLMAPEDEVKRPNFGLTKRELDVVGAIVRGNANKDIAREFSISEDTVKHHLTNIFNKTGVSNRLELALFAVDHSLVLRD